MRKLAILLVCCCATSAQATLFLYEPFDYTTGSTIVPGSTSINSGNGLVDTYNTPNTTWVEAGAYTTTAPFPPAHQIASSGLTAPAGFPASLGRAAVLEGGASGHSDFKEMARMNLPGGPYGTSSVTYYSLLLRVSDLAGLTTAHSNVNANNDLIIGFNNTTGASSALPNTWAGELTIRLGLTANTYNLGIRASTTVASTTFFEPTDYTTSDTLLIVTRWTEGATAGTGGLSEIWVNPSSATFGAVSAPAADGSTVGTFSVTGTSDHTNSILIGAGIAAGSNPNETLIDELRVGTTWADVTSVTSVPEPAAWCFLLAVGGLMIAWQKAGKPLAHQVMLLRRQR